MIMTPDVPTGPWRVVVGVSGSIAAYKAPFVVRLLRQAGHEVKVVATESALRFIGAPALAAVSGKPVSTGVFDDPAAVEHVAVAEWAELVVVAPASADLLARVRVGRADDMLTATILTCQAPVVLAPAMHTQMWVNPATRENVALLRERGLTVIEPDSGRLTGKDSGVGRMPEPEQIVSQSLAALTHAAAGFAGAQEASGEGDKSLQGRHVVISAGGTREPIDPVRYLGNRSSGRQGCALAAAAAEQAHKDAQQEGQESREAQDAKSPQGAVEDSAKSVSDSVDDMVEPDGGQEGQVSPVEDKPVKTRARKATERKSARKSGDRADRKPGKKTAKKAEKKAGNKPEELAEQSGEAPEEPTSEKPVRRTRRRATAKSAAPSPENSSDAPEVPEVSA